ncbi:hypothetical protein [Halobacillus hunanensis]|uniref:hypothetical protein n=1 Tax=Halobacillus hunanensis TaxID=578214 RepID=UPI0009A69028|nr:hypothetical protein [Halobacillus hunanensis]
MKRAAFCTTFFALVLLAGCTREPSFEKHFNETMDNQGSSYNLIHHKLDVVDKDDAIAIYKKEDKIWLSYFKRMDNKWINQEGHGLKCGAQINWTSINGYIFSGLICDNGISEVYIDNNTAKFININDGKRYWYIVTPKQRDIEEVEVRFVKKDGTEEIVDNYNPKIE